MPLLKISMTAAVLNVSSEQSAIETLPDPVLGTSEVVADVLLLGGQIHRRYLLGCAQLLLMPPVALGPGGIRRVHAIGDALTCISLMETSMVTGIQMIRQVSPEKRRSRHLSACATLSINFGGKLPLLRLIGT